MIIVSSLSLEEGKRWGTKRFPMISPGLLETCKNDERSASVVGARVCLSVCLPVLDLEKGSCAWVVPIQRSSGVLHR